jgi:ABC-type dipeptide/oligopeptide/nickel transport system permease subunit
VATIAAGYFVLPIAVWAFVRALTLTLNAAVWCAAAIGSGTDTWTIVTTIIRAAAEALATPAASGIIGALVVVSAAAFFGIQRLLGSEERSSR